MSKEKLHRTAGEVAKSLAERGEEPDVDPRSASGAKALLQLASALAYEEKTQEKVTTAGKE